MAEKIKYTRKDLKGPDEFLSAFGRAIEWTKENRSAVLAVALGVLVLFGGVFGAQAYFSWEENKATRDLWPHLNRAREVMQAPTAADAEKLSNLERILTTHVKEHPKTTAAVYAMYYLGNIAFIQGNYGMSEAHFRAAIQAGKLGEIMPFLLRKGLAQALEAKGDFAAATDAYRDAASVAGGELRVQAQIGQARTMDIAGRKQEAAALLGQILMETTDAGTKEFIEIKLAQSE